MQMPAGIRKIGPPNPMTQKKFPKKPGQQTSPPQVDPGPIAGGPTPAGGSGGIYQNPNTPANTPRPARTSPGPMAPPHMLAPQEPTFPMSPGNSSMYGVGGGEGGGTSMGGDGGAPLGDLGDALMMTVPDWMRNAQPMEQNINGTGVPMPGRVNPFQPNPGGGIINLPDGNGGPMVGNRDPNAGGVRTGPMFETPPEIQALGPRAVEMFRNQYGRGNNNPAGIIERFKRKRNGGQGRGNPSFGVPNALP